jgi:hypothetical protein
MCICFDIFFDIPVIRKGGIYTAKRVHIFCIFCILFDIFCILFDLHILHSLHILHIVHIMHCSLQFLSDCIIY